MIIGRFSKQELKQERKEIDMYCFLNCVYTDLDDVSKVYEVVKCDDTFSTVTIERVSLIELEQLAQSSDLITDFCFEEGYLKCDPVKRVWCDASVENSMKQHLTKTDSYGNKKERGLYSLLMNGVNDGYYFIADELVGLKSYKGTGVVPFSHVRFSQSSMSLFFREVVNGVGSNHYIISTEANSVNFRPFYFLVPATLNESLPYEFKGSMNVNNVEYTVYYSDMLGVVEPINIISPVVLNKASCARAKYASAVNAAKLVLDSCIPSNDKVEWDNSSHKIHNIRTIRFNCTMKPLTTSDVAKIHTDVKKLIDEFHDFDIVRQEIARVGYKSPAYYVAMWFAFISFRIDNQTDLIAIAKESLELHCRRLFFADLYLYRIRMYYCYNGGLTLPLHTVIYGSNEDGVTVIEEVTQ